MILDMLKKVNTVFKKYNIEYMFIGRLAAITQGFTEMTNDIDVYPEDTSINNEKIITALLELGYDISETKKEEIRNGKDFISFQRPFQLDLVFYPDGFENYNQAKKYKVMVQDYPVMNIDGIIISKEKANRPKDKAALPMLKSFAQWKNKF
jgi:hypothetical protein